MGFSNTKKVKLDLVQEVLDLTQLVYKAIDVEMTNLKVLIANCLFKLEKRIFLGFCKLGVE